MLSRLSNGLNSIALPESGLDAAILRDDKDAILHALLSSGLSVWPDALLVSGSFARLASDRYSDIDIIVVHEDSLPPLPAALGGRTLDVSSNSRDGFRTKLLEDNNDNNNYILNLFSDAIIILDKDDIGADLKSLARALLERGPVALSRTKAARMLQGLRKILHATEKAVHRSADRTVPDCFSRIRCDHLIDRSTYAFCKAQRMWTSSLIHTVERLATESPELYSLWQDYCSTVDTGSRYDLASQACSIATEALERIVIPENPMDS